MVFYHSETETGTRSMGYCCDRPDLGLGRIVEVFWNLELEKGLMGYSVGAWKIRMFRVMQMVVA